MTRALALLLLFASPAMLGIELISRAFAGDNAPPGGWAVERPYLQTVHEADVLDAAYWDRLGITQEELMWAVFDGGSPDLRPAPVPVPLPGAGLLLAAACGLLGRMR